MFGIGSITREVILQAVIGFCGLIQYFLGNLLATVAGLLGWFLKFQGSYFENVTIVQESWKVFRDFSNMFFILILIVIAFATIFDLQNYNWRGLMAKFIIAALLINFSLAIGGFLIRISTTLSNVALNQFTDITNNLAAGFGINKLITASPLTGTSGDPSANLALSAYLSTTGTLIMTAIVLCAFVSAFAFSVARVPVLWALLIVSPIALTSTILPSTRRVWSMWWNWFFCWTFFMPAYLFSLVMGIAILNNRPDIEAAKRLSGGTGLAAVSNFVGLGIQEIFFYILTLLIMVGSLGLAMKMACAAGTGIAATFGAVNKWTQDKIGYTAAKKAVTQKVGEIKDTGLKGRIGGFLYGGERAERLKEAKVAEFLGKKGALSEAEAAEVQKSYALRKSQNLSKDDLDKLNAQAVAGKFNNFETLALRKLRAENGWVASGTAGVQEIESTLREAGENSKFGQEYIDALKKNGFAEALGSTNDAENLARNTTILPLKKAILETMAKNNQIIQEDLVRMTLDVFSTDSREIRENIEKELQKNIKNLTGTRTKKDRGTALADRTAGNFIADNRVRKLLALQMLEGDEINNYAKYKEAEGLFGGIYETKSREMRNKIENDDKLTFAEIETREDARVNKPNPATALASPDLQILADKYDKTIAKIKDAKSIADIDADKWKERPLLLQRALQNKITILEASRPTVPAGTMINGRRLTKPIPGAGNSFLTALQKATGNSPDKIAIVKNLTV